jgi:hypothetical protein
VHYLNGTGSAPMSIVPVIPKPGFNVVVFELSRQVIWGHVILSGVTAVKWSVVAYPLQT